MPWDEGARKLSFNTFKSPLGPARIILANHDKKIGVAFLTGPHGNLEAVAKGDFKEIWRWTRQPITPDLRASFIKEVSYWKSMEVEVAKEPDRKD